MPMNLEGENDTDESLQLSYGDIVKKILDLYASDTYKDLSKYYAKKDFFRLIGRARKEDTHSNMLAWLLDPAESHGLGAYPLKRFLQKHVETLVAKLLLGDQVEQGDLIEVDVVDGEFNLKVKKELRS